MKRIARPVVRTLAGLAAIALAVLLAEVSGWPFLRQALQNTMARATGVPVQMDGKFNVQLLWRPRLQIDRLVLGAAHGLPVPHLLDAGGVDLAWRWRDIWRWHRGAALRVDRLSADLLDAHLVRNAAGLASWQLGAPGKAVSEHPERDPLGDLPRFGRLEVRNGHIAVDDQPLKTRLQIEVRGGEGEGLQTVTAMRSAASASASSASRTASIGSTPPVAGARAAAAPPVMRVGYHATVKGRWQALPLRLDIRTAGTLPLLQDALSDADGNDADARLPLRVEGEAGAARLFFDGTAGALLGAHTLQGALRFSGPSLATVGEPLGLTLPQTPPFSLRGQLGHAAGVWHLRADRAEIGRSLLDGDFDFDTRSTPPRLTGRLGGSRLALADLGPAVGGPAQAASAPAEVKKASDAQEQARPPKVLPQRRFDLPSLRAMDADVTVAIKELDFGSDALSALRDLQTHVLLQDSVLRLQDLQATVAGGQFAGNTSLDARAQIARWSADMRFSTVDVAGWLKGLQSAEGRAEAPPRGRVPNNRQLKQQRDMARKGGDQPVQAYLTGALNGNFQVSGRGNSTAEILSTLDGKAHVMLRDGTVSHLVTELAGLDIAQALGVLIRSDQPLPLRCARVDLQVQQGVARPQVAVLDNADSTVRVAGEINLRDETLALKATTRPKDFSPLTLRAPITVNGTLAEPKVGVDGKRITAKVLGAVALGAIVAPVTALIPLIDRGDPEKGDPCATATPAPSAASASSPAAKASRASR